MYAAATSICSATQKVDFLRNRQTEIGNRRYAWWLKNGLKKRSDEGMVDKMWLNRAAGCRQWSYGFYIAHPWEIARKHCWFEL
ncbi:MAG: hypothetical protein V2J65_13605 [Desulfobacteraceae bacterium]|nr:hypothetical protein [Desulfobacteraceae bacterium]